MRKDKKLYVASFCGLGLTVMSGVALSQVPEGALAVNSAERSVSASVTVATACTMNGVVEPGQAHTATVLPGTYTKDIGLTTLTVTCNDPGGFSVYAVGYTQEQWGYTDLIGYGNSDFDIATGLAESGETSNWAMKVNAVDGDYAPTIENNYNNYHIVPNDSEKVASFPSATNSVNGSKMTTTYAAYVSSAQVAGTYEGQVKYILVNPTGADRPTKPVCVGYNKMQDIASLKDTLFTTAGAQVQLCDTRDGKLYYASKLADGNIWMTQNLDLDLDSAKALTSNDTDLAVLKNSAGYSQTDDGVISWVPTRSTINGTEYSSSTWANDNNSPYSWNPGDYRIDNGGSDTACTSNDFSTCNDRITATSPLTSSADHYHEGNLYNWSAAVASNASGTDYATAKYTIADNSICPKGWKLPSSLPAASTAGMHSKLLYASNIITTEYTGTSSATYTTDGATKILQDPLWLVRGGYVGGGSVSPVSTLGGYWSSSVYSASSAYLLFFNSSSVDPQYSFYYRNYGVSVRCVAR